MTRAVTMALQGRWAESARTHPGGIPTAAYLAGQLLLRAALLWLRPASRRVRTWDLALSLAGLFLAACLPALV